MATLAQAAAGFLISCVWLLSWQWLLLRRPGSSRPCFPASLFITLSTPWRQQGSHKIPPSYIEFSFHLRCNQVIHSPKGTGKVKQDALNVESGERTNTVWCVNTVKCVTWRHSVKHDNTGASSLWSADPAAFDVWLRRHLKWRVTAQ